MIKQKIFLVFILAFTVLFSECNSSGTKIQQEVKTAAGLVRGVHIESGDITVFKGVPFAAPPVGDFRWKAPQPVTPWEGVKECSSFAPSPIQRTPQPFSMWTQEFIAPAEPLSEDCLYLNIWTGAEYAGENRPVFVYIYGGGFNSGSGAVPVYDGEEMAKKGLVFITINYRVGILGFLAHPELSNEAAYKASGNYGLLDQIAALQWVRNNIEAFGGDPGNVTIAGQSAGAFSVNYLVASPLASGLFQRAIAESGGAILSSFSTGRGNELEMAERQGTEWMESTEATSLDALRALSADEIMKYPGSASPVIDGYVLPDDLYTIFSEGRQNDVPCILGWNRDEGFGGAPTNAEAFKAGLKRRYGAHAEELLDLYPVNTDEDAAILQNKLGSLGIFGAQSYAWMLLQHQSGKSKIFMYRFDRELPFAEGMTDFGAFHTGEVPYAYNNLHMSPRPWTEEDYALANTMSSFWVNFARKGDPNGDGLPLWEACVPDNLKAMIFNITSVCEDLPDERLLDFMYRFNTGTIGQ